MAEGEFSGQEGHPGGRTLAKMRKMSASYEFVIHIFEPFMIQLFPSFLALVCNAKASDPDAASDRQNDPS